MTCKYFDSGWCYAPKGVENNSVQGGCFEPEYCPYLMEHNEELKKAIQNLKNFQEQKKTKTQRNDRTRTPGM